MGGKTTPGGPGSRSARDLLGQAQEMTYDAWEIADLGAGGQLRTGCRTWRFGDLPLSKFGRAFTHQFTTRLPRALSCSFA